MNFYLRHKKLLWLATVLAIATVTGAGYIILGTPAAQPPEIQKEVWPEKATQETLNPYTANSWQQTEGVPVLCYHQIVSEEEYRRQPTPFAVTDRQFAEQMALLSREGYYTISTRELEAYLKGQMVLEISARRRPILITFDDGNNDFQRYARQELNKYRYKAVLFIYPTYIMAKKKRSLSWDEIRDIAKDGHEIGSHALWHPKLSELTEKEQLYQFVESKKILEKNVPGITVDTLAYPFGIYTDASQRLLRDSGYRLAFTTFRGGNLPGQNPMAAKRYLVLQSDNLSAYYTYLTTRSLPVEPQNLMEGAWLRGPTELYLKLPAKLESKALSVKVSGKLQQFDYEPFGGRMVVYLHPTNKRLTVLEILFRQGDVTYRADLLFNNQRPKPNNS